MLNFYRAKYSLIRNGVTVVSKFGWHEILRDEAPQDFRTVVTWQDLENSDLNVVMPKIKRKRRGRVLIYDDANAYLYIKEWQEPVLDLEYSVTYQKINMSLWDVLNYYDSAKAIKYLAEKITRG